MGRQIKKKARSFSLDDDEWSLVLDRYKLHGFRDRNEYLMRLVEADCSLGFTVTLNQDNQKVLRPFAEVAAMVAESAPEKINSAVSEVVPHPPRSSSARGSIAGASRKASKTYPVVPRKRSAP